MCSILLVSVCTYICVFVLFMVGVTVQGLVRIFQDRGPNRLFSVVISVYCINRLSALPLRAPLSQCHLSHLSFSNALICKCHHHTQYCKVTTLLPLLPVTCPNTSSCPCSMTPSSPLTCARISRIHIASSFRFDRTAALPYKAISHGH